MSSYFEFTFESVVKKVLLITLLTCQNYYKKLMYYIINE